MLFHPFSLSSFMLKWLLSHYLGNDDTTFASGKFARIFLCVCMLIRLFQNPFQKCSIALTCSTSLKWKNEFQIWRTLVNLQGNEALFSLGFKICNGVILKQKQQALARLGKITTNLKQLINLGWFLSKYVLFFVDSVTFEWSGTNSLLKSSNIFQYHWVRLPLCFCS